MHFANKNAVFSTILVLYLISISLFISCRNFPENSLNKVSVQFYIQPYLGTTIEINEKPVPVKLISTENTQALIETQILEPLSNTLVNIFLKASDGKILRDKFFLKNNRINPLMFQITGTEYRLKDYYPTGKQPKSVTFINNRMVCIPSLHENSGIFIVDITDGTTRELHLPEKFLKKGGFVESLVIKKRNELLVSQMTTAMIHVFDLKSLNYKWSVQLGGKWTKVMVYYEEKDLVYASNWISYDISIIDLNQKKEISRIDVGGVPRGLMISQDRSLLYYTIYERKDGSAGYYGYLNLKNYSKVPLSSSRGSKRHLVSSDKHYFLSDMSKNTVEVFEHHNHKRVKIFSVCQKPNTIALAPDFSRLYISCRGPNGPNGYLNKGSEFGKLMVIDARELKILYQIEGGNQPTGLDISPDGQFVVLSDFLDHRIRVYKMESAGR